jgi:hypothetical protein
MDTAHCVLTPAGRPLGTGSMVTLSHLASLAASTPHWSARRGGIEALRARLSHGERLLWSFPSLADAMRVLDGHQDERIALLEPDLVIVLRRPCFVDQRFVRPAAAALARRRPQLVQRGHREELRRAVYDWPQHVVPLDGDPERARLGIDAMERLAAASPTPRWDDRGGWLDLVVLPRLAAGRPVVEAIAAGV